LYNDFASTKDEELINLTDKKEIEKKF